ncbi:MAG: TRASH domain-containing protein [Desulfurococcales archaeon]|nr:TRASH domain-containing protein [Desulfurococcales archaeon]MCE4622188.1 TRASH domain-containing protein [Desulfurococcales archaeon]MCE4626453.1 TRASH domain-containing protein [Desulfurococcales archaeon]MCE4628735.1 TRASH domain-containing protein [Desulfurococcales archaeon]NOZ31295.1 TRASH domain-containing protein [Thermoproteota archaeon]
MPKLRTCDYCGRSIEPGTGIMFVTRRGQVLWFCSSKCYKNFLKLRRRPDRLAWIKKMKKKLA